jgi:hypothetical protein
MLPVLSKVPCLFVYELDASGKPTGATRDALACEPVAPVVTAKMHGTCCYIRDGAIHARQDVRVHRDTDLSPAGIAAFIASKAPPSWFPTAGTEPDKGGHIIGFRPLDPKKGDRWHLDAISTIDPAFARFLDYDPVAKEFFYEWKKIEDYNGMTVELVGPKLNANPHHLGLHAYCVHGSVVLDAPWRTKKELRDWLDTGEGLQYEGIVIHDRGTGLLYKCHRGHLATAEERAANPESINNWKGYPLRVRA